MIRVHAAVERNTNSAVERINKFQILKKKFPVSQKLIPGFFKKEEPEQNKTMWFGTY